MKCWEWGDNNEKVILWLFFNLRHDKAGWGDRENVVHYNPLRSPGTPLVSNFDASQATRFKTW